MKRRMVLCGVAHSTKDYITLQPLPEAEYLLFY